jgi:hypothetical protein
MYELQTCIARIVPSHSDHPHLVLLMPLPEDQIPSLAWRAWQTIVPSQQAESAPQGH